MSDEVKKELDYLNHDFPLLLKEGRYSEALKIATEIPERISQKVGNDSLYFAESLIPLASLYIELGAYSQAQKLLTESLHIQLRNLGEDNAVVAKNLNRLGMLYYQTKQYAKAEEHYQRALKITRKVLGEINIESAYILGNLATLYRAVGQYSKVEPLLLRVLEISRSVTGDNNIGSVPTLNNLAMIYRSNAQYDNAKELYQKALEIRRKVLGENHPDVAQTLNDMGMLYQDMGDYAKAEELYQKALEMRRKVLGENHPDVAQTLNDMGMLYQDMGDYAKATDFLLKAIQIRKDILGEVHRDYANSLGLLAVLCKRMKEYARAEELYQKALEIRRKVLGENHPDVTQTLNDMGMLYQDMGDYAKAEELYQKALKMRRKGENLPDVAQSLSNLADLYAISSRNKEAETLYLEAIDIVRRFLGKDHLKNVPIMNNLASLYFKMTKYRRAKKLYQKALEIRRKVLGENHPEVAQSLSNLALTFIMTGRPHDALEIMEEMSAIYESMMGILFSIHSESTQLAYIEHLREFFFIFLSLVSQLLPNHPAAISSAFDFVLKWKAIGIEALGIQNYALLSSKYPEMKPKIEELNTMQKQIDQMIQKLHTMQSLNSKTTLEASKEEHELVSFQERLEKLNIRKQELEKMLAHKIPEIQLYADYQRVNRNIIANAMKEDDALVEFLRIDVLNFNALRLREELVWKEARYLCFILTARETDNLHMIDLGEADQIDKLIVTFKNSLITGDSLEVIKANGCELRRSVFDPLLPLIYEFKHLLIAPHGELTRLPFGALPTNGESYLIDDYFISYLSTGRDMLSMSGIGASSSAPLVIADVDFDFASGHDIYSTVMDSKIPTTKDAISGSIAFPHMTDTQQEGQLIADMLNVWPWLGEGVLKTRLEDYASPRILHIATHGFFLPNQQHPKESRRNVVMDGIIRRVNTNYENPLLRAGLALAGANTWIKGASLPVDAENGILTAKDISGLDLSGTELVVLSACDTGLGDIYTGESVFALRRAFALAGAGTLAMSLWRVDASSTRDLLIDFYRRILSGGPKAEALRDAQLSMKRRYPHPFYWGALICQGDPGPLASSVTNDVVQMRYPHITLQEKIEPEQISEVKIIIRTTPPRSSEARIKFMTGPDETEVNVIIIIESEGFEIVDKFHGIIRVPINDEDSDPLSFKIKAKELGLQTLRFAFFKGAAYLTEIKMNVRVEPNQKYIEQSKLQVANDPYKIVQKSKFTWKKFKKRRDPDISIFVLNKKSSQLEYEVFLSSSDFTLRPMGTINLPQPEDFLRTTFMDVEEIMLTDTIKTASLNDIGLKLYEELFPNDLKSLYWNIRNEIKSVMLVSDDPWIPWEIIKPWRRLVDGSIEVDAFLCERYAFSRLFPGKEYKENDRVKKIAVVIPPDTGLGNAKNEGQWIKEFGKQIGVDVSIDSTYAQFRDTLQKGGLDLLHFSTHRKYISRDSDFSTINLEGGYQMRPEDISGIVAEAIGRDNPLVILNSCQSGVQGLALTGIQDWAKRFIEAGASAFIGTIWSVSDKTALKFTQELYTQLSLGTAIGEAVRRARNACKEGSYGDPIGWLTYQLYGHPGRGFKLG